MQSFRPKDGSGEPPTPGHNGERDFHGEKRSNETLASITNPDARLARQSNGQAAVLCYARACGGGRSDHAGDWREGRLFSQVLSGRAPIGQSHILMSS